MISCTFSHDTKIFTNQTYRKYSDKSGYKSLRKRKTKAQAKRAARVLSIRNFPFPVSIIRNPVTISSHFLSCKVLANGYFSCSFSLISYRLAGCSNFSSTASCQPAMMWRRHRLAILVVRSLHRLFDFPYLLHNTVMWLYSRTEVLDRVAYSIKYCSSKLLYI